MGGLPRRATFISQEKDQGPATLILDSGDVFAERPLSEPSLAQAGDKADLMLRAMDHMGYGAVALGEMDLYLGLDKLKNLDRMTDVKFLSANLTDRNGRTLFSPHEIFKTGGIRVGVIGLTAAPSNRAMFSRRMPGSVVQDPMTAARKEAEKIRDKCDLLVVLSNMGYARDMELARDVSGIDVIISGGTRRFMKRPVVEGKTLITSGYYEGRAVGRLVVHLEGAVKGWISSQEMEFLDRQMEIAGTKLGTPAGQRNHDALVAKKESAAELTLYEPDMVNLEPSLPDDPDIAAMIADYRQELAKGVAGSPAQGASSSEQVQYTGSETCARCHESRYRFWLTTAHSRAFDSLAPKNAVGDPDCLPCHVTGYMRRTGYWPKAPREDLRGVQCEVCHGVGSLHAASPDLYSLLHLPAAPQCMDCHTESQDDDFDYFREKALVCSEINIQ